ncbi:hypothetical protein WN48_10273 [Eufriesea mexicana]|uniref:Uncharacterized protein n=1 Tax=Eufriesea mexicana TaxID=516756 RepID=A0A310SGK8_9HYME|nr:hypothetical protein WN48_10273 [Eufriesea mexicana]
MHDKICGGSWDEPPDAIPFLIGNPPTHLLFTWKPREKQRACQPRREADQDVGTRDTSHEFRHSRPTFQASVASGDRGELWTRGHVPEVAAQRRRHVQAAGHSKTAGGDRRFRARRNAGRIKQSLSDRVQPSANSERPRFKFGFREKARKPGEESLDTGDPKALAEQGQARAKLHKSDSFLKRFVRSSKDNIAEGCERLVRNIQKSPLVLRKKFLPNDEQRPEPPVRRKKSKKKPPEVDCVGKESFKSFYPDESTDIRVSVVCPTAELIEDDFLLVHKEPQVQGNNHEPPPSHASSNRISVIRSIDDEDSSKSVSVEDVEELIRTEDNLRLLEQRVLVRRRLEKSTKLLQALQPCQRRSWSEESLFHAIEQVHHKFQVGFPISKISIDSVAVDCSPIAHRRYARSACNQRRPAWEQSRSPEWRKKVEWRSWKAKRSPPPDDWQVQRSSRLEWSGDNGDGSADKLVPARKSRIRGDQVHARPTATSHVKCKLANFATSGGDDAAETRDREPAEEQSKQRLVANRLDENSSYGQPTVRHPSTPVHEPSHGSRVCPGLRIESTSVNDALGDSDLVTIRVNLGELDHVDDDHDARQPGRSLIATDPTPGKTRSKGQARPPTKKKRVKSKECKVVQGWNEGKMRFTIRMIRIRDKLMLGLSAFAILFTILLVMDLQMDLGYSGHHLVPSHGRVRVGDDPNTDTIYNNFRRKFLQRLNASKEQSSGDVSGTTQNSAKESGSEARDSRTEKTEVHDSFPDLVDIVVKSYGVSVYEGVARISGEDHSYNPTLGELKKVSPR